ncbi:MAG: hypothetical protein AAGL98_00075 [Planctomycetota bacterium]
MSTQYPWQAGAVQPTPSATDIKEKLRDFEYYREHFLTVRPREGGDRKPFMLNSAQGVLHARIEEERKTFGMVRALIPKARRMGVSTYIGGRYFHQTATRFGRRAQVVAHRSDSATNLHREVKEFCNGLPPPLRPSIGATNARELIFDRLKSLYKVASAEGGDIGRSDDFHLLHLSEAAFFDNTEDLSSGLLQTVQDIDGTEIAMESTGNGQSGMFFSMCEEAHRNGNKGPWRLHFLPWVLMPEYRASVPFAWKAPQEFEEYARLHGLDREQLYFFWLKNYTIAAMNGGQPEKIHRLSRQEYPAIYSECFMADSTLDFFSSSLVAAAMARKPNPSAGALKLLCVDPAGDGQDKPFVCDRQGSAIGARVWGELASRDYNVQADWLVQTFRRFDMDAICIDVTGIGKGLVDATRLRMRTEGPEKVIAVNFAHGAMNEVLYGNRRAELHDRLQRWMQGDVYMPNDKLLQEEAAAYKWGTGGCRRDEKMRLFMTPKEKVRAEIGRSPDRLDACAVSMAVEG